MKVVLKMVLLCIVFQCKTPIKEGVFSIEKYKLEGLSLSNKAYSLLIPIEGCGYCISSTLSFATNHQENEFLQIVLSNYSTKNIDNKVTEYKLTRNGIIYDDGLLFTKLGLSTASPILMTNLESSYSLDTLIPENIDEILNDLELSLALNARNKKKLPLRVIK